jgi:hypothetical protein
MGNRNHSDKSILPHKCLLRLDSTNKSKNLRKRKTEIIAKSKSSFQHYHSRRTYIKLLIYKRKARGCCDLRIGFLFYPLHHYIKKRFIINVPRAIWDDNGRNFCFALPYTLDFVSNNFIAGGGLGKILFFMIMR